MITKEELMRRLSVLIEKYKLLTNEEINSMSEDDTRQRFINKLLIDVLDWDDDKWESQRSVEINGKLKHPDYWYPNPPKVIVEAKKLKLDNDIENGVFNKQVQDYAYSKAVNWAILTNFRIFIAWYITRDKIEPFCNLDLVTGNPEYIADKLIWFQNDNLLYGGIEDEAKRRGIELKKIDIAEDFTANLNSLRDIISDYIKRNYKKYDDNEREELVQGLINRLIFIKKTEADGIEPNDLEGIYRNISKDIYLRIKELFRQYRKKYDTDIFGKPTEESEVERLGFWDNVTYKILETISKPKNGAEYNFSAIDVDVLGTIYENYLAYIHKDIKHTKSREERKEKGIYYTPKYVVEYIVKNTLDSLLKTTNYTEANKIRVLDLACGSGSFLIGAIEVLDNYYAMHVKGYKQLPPSKKLTIIRNNLYGVDLDERAVQIAKLSVYLKILTLTQKEKRLTQNESLLPELKDNIKFGNSLIDNKELAKDAAFDWENQFAEGFDVIIGNPPYINIRLLTKTNAGEKEFYEEHYDTAVGNYDIYILFIEKAIRLLRNGGRLGFIVPNKFTVTDYGLEIRKFILENCIIEKIIDISNLPVFKGVGTYPLIIILKKENDVSKRNNNKIETIVVNDEAELLGDLKYLKVKQSEYKKKILTPFSFSVTVKNGLKLQRSWRTVLFL